MAMTMKSVAHALPECYPMAVPFTLVKAILSTLFNGKPMIDLIAKSHYEADFDLIDVSATEALIHIDNNLEIDFFIVLDGKKTITENELTLLAN